MLIQKPVEIPEEELESMGKNRNGRQSTKKELLKGIDYLDKEGAEIIIMGCTEIPLAIKDNKINGKPLIDSTKILARALILKSSPEKLIEEIG